MKTGLPHPHFQRYPHLKRTIIPHGSTYLRLRLPLSYTIRQSSDRIPRAASRDTKQGSRVSVPVAHSDMYAFPPGSGKQETQVNCPVHAKPQSSNLTLFHMPPDQHRSIVHLLLAQHIPTPQKSARRQVNPTMFHCRPVGVPRHHRVQSNLAPKCSLRHI